MSVLRGVAAEVAELVVGGGEVVGQVGGVVAGVVEVAVGEDKACSEGLPRSSKYSAASARRRDLVR